ncbi:hypothetical protein QE152_g24922 [Popillia japonica]|uniref:Uncharacterized protein n=1 Tax=Popillia japonica TaxID=7064 RepID=A0AAW1K3T1_POPJA
MSNDNKQQICPGVQSDSDEDIDIARSPTLLIEEEIYMETKPEDFVLIKFPIARSTNHVHYVAEILRCFEDEVEASYLRNFMKNKGKFPIPQVPDNSVAFKNQILFVLPKATCYEQSTESQ